MIYLHGTSHIVLEFLFLFRYFTYSKIGHFKLSVTSFGNNMQSYNCHCNQDSEQFHHPRKLTCALGFFEINFL